MTVELGTEDGTVYASPRYTQVGVPIVLEVGRMGSNPTLTIHGAELDGVDVLGDFSGSTYTPDSDGELIVDATYSGTRYTTRAFIDPAIPSRSDGINTSMANGNGLLAYQPPYTTATATVTPASIGDIRTAVSAASNGSTVVIADSDFSGQTLNLTGITKTDVTVKCASYLGVQVADIDIDNSSGLTIVGFDMSGEISSGSGRLYGDTAVEYCRMTGIYLRGEQGPGGSLDFLHQGTVRCCVTPSGGGTQWTFNMETLRFEQNIYFKNTAGADAVHTSGIDRLYMRRNVISEISFASNSDHADGTQTVYGYLTGYAYDNLVIDQVFSGEEPMQGGLFFADQYETQDFHIRNNIVAISNTNAIVVQNCQENVRIDWNTTTSNISLEGTNVADSLAANNNVKVTSGTIMDSTSDGPETSTYVLASPTTYYSDWNGSPTTWENFIGSGDYATRGAYRLIDEAQAAQSGGSTPKTLTRRPTFSITVA